MCMYIYIYRKAVYKGFIRVYRGLRGYEGFFRGYTCGDFRIHSAMF